MRTFFATELFTSPSLKYCPPGWATCWADERRTDPSAQPAFGCCSKPIESALIDVRLQRERLKCSIDDLRGMLTAKGNKANVQPATRPKGLSPLPIVNVWLLPKDYRGGSTGSAKYNDWMITCNADPVSKMFTFRYHWT